MIDRRPPDHGFVLVATLALLALATLAVTCGARRSLALAHEVAQREDALRSRQLSQSCRRVLVAKSPELLVSADQSLATSTFRIQSRLSEVEVYIADESAKPRLADATRARPRQPIRRANWLALMTEGAEPSSDVELALSARDSSRAATVWGDGRLNLKAASYRVLRAVLGERVGEDRAERVIAVREEHPDWTAQQVVYEAEDSARRRGELLGLLRDTPAAYTVWTVVTPRTEGGRSLVALDVIAGGQSGAQPESYTW